MLSCQDCRQLLWEQVYELLDEDDSRRVREHLARCPACQNELDRAEADRDKLGRAARLDLDIPPFVAPQADSVSTIPFNTPRTRRRGIHPLWAAAAAVLIGLGLLFSYQIGLSYHQTAVELARRQLDDHRARSREARHAFQADQLQLVARFRTGQVLLRVVGPDRYRPGAPNPFRIYTTDLDDQPLTALLSVRLLGSDGRVLFRAAEIHSPGEQLVTLPPNLPAAELAERMEVVARTAAGESTVQVPLSAARPSYRTHVAFSRPAYYQGETVRFRTVTLDAYSRQPPPAALSVRYEIRPPGRTSPLWVRRGTTLDGGIGGGEFTLPDSPVEGEYTLTMTAEQDAFPPQVFRFLVGQGRSQSLRKTVRFDRSGYRPGDRLQAVVQVARLADEQPVVHETVSATIRSGDRDLTTPIRRQTDASGSAAFEFVLPGELSSHGLDLIALIGSTVGQRELVRQRIPLQPHQVELEFFPEGGELLAGVSNRVYVRATTATGHPLAVTATVLDRQGREAARFYTGPHGLGVFRFSPAPEEAYRAEVAQPAEVSTRGTLPAPGRLGLQLSVTAGVLRDNEPLQVTLRNAGAARPVVIGVFCRDVLVAHVLVNVAEGETVLNVPLPAEAVGVLRLTVLEATQPDLRPLAERLVYRIPHQRLHLQVRSEGHGDRCRLQLLSRNETKQAEPAWLLASVFMPTPANTSAYTGLPELFHLLGDLGSAEELEIKDLWLAETAEAQALLDLYLGTQGWRRFIPAGNAPPVRLGIQLRDNGEVLRSQFQQALAARIEPFQAQDRQAAALDQRLVDSANLAGQAFTDYQNRVAGLLRPGAVVLALAAIGSYLLLPWVAQRSWSRLLTPLPHFAGVLALVLLGGMLALPGGDEGGGTLAELTEWEPLTIAFDLPTALTPRPVAEALIAGTVAPPRTTGRTVDERLQELRHSFPLPEGTAPAIARQKPDIAIHQIEDRAVPLAPLPVREYAHVRGQVASGDRATVLLWSPALWADNGTAAVEFEMPHEAGRYRVLIHGHSRSGRLGTTAAELDAARQQSQ